ncbi:hypothetical protein [uncultured Corynebacterium sp.]|uniref:hypothetical protein n=1 Tax=uncultured Corynebacterium sp. TaxID=159447 RepID=UPI0025E95B8F|nr:hypothetical protein [uncultured Corynebacterium sp.]
MTAVPVTLTDADRATLTELAGVDERLRLLTARLDALPETATVERLEQEAEERRRRVLSTRRIAHDMTGTLNRLRSDAARLRARRRADLAGLRADTDRDRRRDLRHDLAVADRRLAEIEADIDREERTLATFGHAREDSGPDAGPDVDMTLRQARDEAEAVAGEIGQRVAGLRDRSGVLRGDLSPELRRRYEESEAEHGMGAAELAGATCRCCCIELDHSAARRIANTPLNHLVTCPECGVLLVRVGE